MKEQKLRYALTQPQQRVWLSEKLYPGTGMWNNAGTLKIKGELNYALLARAMNIFLQENESIRLRIGVDDNTPYQYISEYEPYKIDVLDFSDRGIDKLYEWDSMQSQAPMPLIESDLFYFAHVKLGDNEGGYFAKFHHLISDALSIVEFGNQTMSNYERLLAGQELTPTPTRSYIEYIHSEKDYFESKRFAMDHKYWTNKFEELPEPTVVKQKKTNYFSVKAERKVNVIEQDLSLKIREYCVGNGISAFSLFLSALAIYINRISGKDDIIIGAPVANRSSKNAKGSFGMFVSTVPIRIKVQEDLTFTDFAKVVSGIWFGALKHQKYPYNMLMQSLREKHKNLESLFDVTLSYQIGTFQKDSEKCEYEGRWHFSGYQANSLNIHLNDREADGRVIVDYDHHAPFFSGKEIEYFHAHLINIIRDVIASPDKKLYMLELLADEERDRVLNRFNATEHDFPQGETLVEMWQSRMRVTPKESTAIVFKGKSMSYGELDARSTALALYLRKKGIGANDIVGLLMPRCTDHFVCMLAVLKAGAAFLPIDSELPNERIAYMLSDSGAVAALVSPDLIAKCESVPELLIIKTTIPLALPDDPYVMPICKPNDLAYVIYTSGSTGQPKGVQIEHHSIVHFMYMMQEIWDYSPGARVLCAASFCFDMSIMEALPPLVSGAVLVLAAEHEANIPRNMVRLIQNSLVNIMMVTPGRMELLLSDTHGAASLKDFRDIGMGGDVLPEKLLSDVQQCTGARITNFYGPTEITVCATCTDVTNAKVPNIGSPMRNVKAYILDAHQNPVPIGVPGELYVGGKGVARGYINKLELNEERFIDNPFAAGEKLYRTGDLTRWYPLGEIEFLGRIDKQVKIRGYRIELAEIENRLVQVPGITSCTVADYADSSGRKFLAAYVCGQPPKVADIKAHLVKELPNYMIPSYFMTIDSLPFSPSGKVDKTRLPDPLEGIEARRDDFSPPQTPTETALAQVWQNVLGIEQIDRNDSFFDIGGDSLSIVMVMSQIPQQFHVELALEDVYLQPQLKEVAALIDAAELCSHQPIVSAPKQDDYPVSSAQQRMWIIEQAAGGNAAYNIPMAFKLRGKVNLPRLRAAFEALILRHDSLRTSYVLRGGELRQQIADSVDLPLVRAECKHRELDEQLKSQIKPFDMQTAPLMRAALIKTEKETIFFIDIHHSIADGRSAKILIDDLVALYDDEILPSPLFEYKDYAVWQRSYMKSESIALQCEYWQSTLNGELPLLNLHTDRPRASTQQFSGARLSFNIPKQTADKLRDFAKQHGATLFMSILAVYNILLAKYTGQEDIIVGTPVSGRGRQEVQDIVGVFINTLPLRNRPLADLSFLQFFNQLTKNSISAFAHSDYPLERMISDISLARDASRNPLFDTMLVHSAQPQDFSLGNATCSHYPFDPDIAKLDLTLEVYESDEGLECQFEYNTMLWNEPTIRRISRHLSRLFDTLPDEPDTRIKDVAMLSQNEIWQVTQGFNKTDKPLADISVQSLLEDLAVSAPDKTALICDGQSMTFAQLNNRANQVAHQLRESGVTRNSVVALCLPRSLDLMIGLLAVLKAGGGYLPIDPSYPEDRIAYMLFDSGAAMIIKEPDTDVGFSGRRIHLKDIDADGISTNLPRIDHMEDAAYIIYTSGSTGKPKGCTLPRRGLLNLFADTKSTIAYQPEEISVSVTTVAFDIFIGDAVLPLLNGCTVVLSTEEELRQPHLLADLIERTQATFIQTTPTRMRIMMNDESFRAAAGKHITKIVLGGEMIPISLLSQLQTEIGAQIINGYGPTEATVYSSFKDLTSSSFVTIGRPVENTRMYILNKNKRPVPVGVLGELYISGAGVADGYINRDELTKHSFSPDPYWPGHMMYRTGDVCAFMQDGDVEICGRVDHQVKIRGLRIELGEIEAAMRSVDGIEEAVVKDWGEDVKKYLCAYYSVSKHVDEKVLRGILSDALPSYMIPSFFILMDEVPTTLNGKVDRKALLEPDRKELSKRASIEGVQMSGQERRMSKVWADILGISGIGPDDNFFELGGDSLAVINVQAALVQYGWSVSTKDFYEAQTLRGVCSCVNADQEHEPDKTIESKLDISVPPYAHLSPIRAEKVLLTGATGFLGAHILAKMLKKKRTHVICLVRGKDEQDASARLREQLTFYFGTQSSSEIMKKVSVLCADISKDNLGLDEASYAALKKVDTIIHSAAITDHVGQEDEFEKANVDGTRNITSLAGLANAALVHISTTGVSGTQFTLDKRKHGEFDESSFYIGQNYADNVYINSKFRAEEIVLEAIELGLNARIMRVGMLTATLGGRFQKNPERNAFANRIAALCAIACVPVGMLGANIEMTPVDSCAQAILALTHNQSPRQAIHHVFNTNTMSLTVLISLLEQNGNRIEIISDTAFMEKMTQLSRQGDFTHVSSLVDDLSNYNSAPQIVITASTTTQLLSGAGFSWPVIDAAYMGGFLQSITANPKQGDKEA